MSQRLPRRVGLSRAREMMLTGRTCGGTAALAMGLVNFCVSEGSFEAELDNLAREMLALSWHTHRANKRLLLETDGTSLSAGLANEIYRTAGVGPDMQAHRSIYCKRKI